ncbi:putative peptidoglycan lipid II flippase [Hasllibacter halocynthiae]|uniref:Probable lipid II flippase MurJ n=1 Tax=Hasllibacter halocynthiae TaxID=595589 RepID=A0A2T0X258_9RHOB|nr:murein biosynthesis integral membrane protein MurJ [Hasllibacter halocynthiae]PRY92975.1 putative peptidoglycan lipid II flippase [Hasllibacter halocynthiae]
MAPRPAPRLARAFATVGVWTMLSRVLGFVRDVAFAAVLGAGPVFDAFIVAFSLPNLFRRLFAEGAFNMAFVPMFSKKVEKGDGALPFARDAAMGLATILIVLTVIATAAMPLLVLAMASGFAGDERFDLAVLYGRIAFPYILFISLAALLSGVLNATGRFVAAAAAPALLNVLFVAAVALALHSGLDVGLVLAWTVPIAGAAQLALVWWAAARAGYRLVPGRPRITPELKRLAVIAAPAALAGGVVQVNLLVGRQVASRTEGAITWLSLADRLYQLPLGVVGIAVGVVLLPELSRRLSDGDAAAGRRSLSRAAEFALALTVPAAVALLVVPLPLVSALFQRGAFGPDDTAATAVAVAIYGLGLPAFVLQKVWQPVFFAREDTRTPFRIAVAAMVVNAALAFGLMPAIGFAAAAVATTVAGWATFLLLARAARRHGEDVRLLPDAKARIWRIVLASLAMGVVVWGANLALLPVFGTSRTLGIVALVAVGILSYGLLGQLFGAFRLRDLVNSARR